MTIHETFNSILTIIANAHKRLKAAGDEANKWIEYPMKRNTHVVRTMKVSMPTTNCIKFEEKTELTPDWGEMSVSTKIVLINFIGESVEVKADGTLRVYANGICDEDLKTILGDTALFNEKSGF